MRRSPLIATALALATAAGGPWVASCLPEPHSLVGRACDAEHPCGEEGLACCQGACQIASPGLECDEPEPPGTGDGARADGGVADGGDGGFGDGAAGK